MLGSVIAYWLPKAGNEQIEYEDAWAVSPIDLFQSDEISSPWLSVAMADGASESLLSGPWARALVQSLIAAPVDSIKRKRDFLRMLTEAAREWRTYIEGYVDERAAIGKPITWYEQPGIDRGAFATLLGLHLASTDPLTVNGFHGQVVEQGRWFAVSIGDTCMFHVRDDLLLAIFPMAHSDDFGNSPALVASRLAATEMLSRHTRLAEGSFAQGDDFFICTDALALWIAQRVEDGTNPWWLLRDLADVGFEPWVNELRERGELHNDDTTLVHVDIW